MIEDYLDIDLKRFAWFIGLVILVAVLTTLLYWFVFGCESWKKNMQIASDLMLAATGSPLQQQQIQPYQQMQMQMQPYQQIQTQPYQQQIVQPQPFSNGISAQTNNVSGQYVCPVHGAIGLPQFNAAGSPVCPLGDQIMQFCSTGTSTNNLALAAGG